jgi:hypothetical protein
VVLTARPDELSGLASKANPLNGISDTVTPVGARASAQANVIAQLEALQGFPRWSTRTRAGFWSRLRRFPATRGGTVFDRKRTVEIPM